MVSLELMGIHPSCRAHEVGGIGAIALPDTVKASQAPPDTLLSPEYKPNSKPLTAFMWCLWPFIQINHHNMDYDYSFDSYIGGIPIFHWWAGLSYRPSLAAGKTSSYT